MNFKIKNVLVLLFIVITLLLVVNSVNAADTYENNTIVGGSLASVNDASIENFNNDISEDVIAINSDDGNEIEEQNSVVEVSSSEDKLGISDEDVLAGRFYINVVSDTPVVKPGDEVVFDVYVQNTGNTYYGVWDNEAWNNVLPINNWIDSNEFELLYIEPTDGWGQNYVNVTPEFSYYWDGSSYLIVKYKVWEWRQWYDLHYKVHLKAKDPGVPGEYQFKAQIYDTTYWDPQNANDEASATVTVGSADLNITKTPHQTVYCLGDDVYFDIYIENNGTLPLVDTCWWDTMDQYPPLIWIDDWYDPGLVFVDITFNPDKNGNIWAENYYYADEYDGPYGHQLLIQYLTQGDWKPGYSLNFTVHFKANKTGQLNNSAHVFWKWKSWGPNEVHEHIERWGNNSVYVGVPEFTVEKVALTKEVKVGEDVIFNVTVTNTGDINLTGVYIQDNEYTNGLEYSDYSDKGLWTFDGTDKWTYNGTLAPGESISLMLTFTATSPGVKNNTAVCGNNVTNETLNSTDNVTVTEEDEPDVPDEPEVPDEPDVPEETPDEKEVHVETLKPVKNATGNPLFVLLLCLIALGFVPSRGKK